MPREFATKKAEINPPEILKNPFFLPDDSVTNIR
jgi:hypothetical protein